jgi:hypothetical protein
MLRANLPKVLRANLPKILRANLPKILRANLPKILRANLPKILRANLPKILRANYHKMLRANLSQGTQGKGKTTRRYCADLPTRNPKWTGLESNLDCFCETPATNRCIYGTK